MIILFPLGNFKIKFTWEGKHMEMGISKFETFLRNAMRSSWFSDSQPPTDLEDKILLRPVDRCSGCGDPGVRYEIRHWRHCRAVSRIDFISYATCKPTSLPAQLKIEKFVGYYRPKNVWQMHGWQQIILGASDPPTQSASPYMEESCVTDIAILSQLQLRLQRKEFK